MAKMGYLLADGVKGYTQWRKALWTDPDLRDRFTASRRSKWDARQVAEGIAMFGQNGRDCFPAAETVADVLGCTRAVVERQKRWLIEQGWFVKVRPVGRTHALAIAVPGHVANEWRTGARSWGAQRRGVFNVDLMNLPPGVVVPDTVVADGVDCYPEDNWTPDVGEPPF